MTHLPACLDGAALSLALVSLGFPAPAVVAPVAPAYAPGTLVLVDTLTGEWVEPLGTDCEDEAETILLALNGPDGTRYTVDVA